MEKLPYQYKNQLEKQSKLLDINLYNYNLNVDIFILKKPSNEKYAIYRCLWDNGFNPTKRDWVYNYVFLSQHISDKMEKDLKLNIHEIFYILKNEKCFYLLYDSGQFKDSELQTLYSKAFAILLNLKITLESVKV